MLVFKPDIRHVFSSKHRKSAKKANLGTFLIFYPRLVVIVPKHYGIHPNWSHFVKANITYQCIGEYENSRC